MDLGPLAITCCAYFGCLVLLMRITMRNMTEPNFETEGKHSVKNNHENSVLIGVRPEVPHPGLFLCRTVFEEGWAGRKSVLHSSYIIMARQAATDGATTESSQ